MMKSKAHQNKLMKIIKLPIRALAKVRDFYVRGMNYYGDKVCYAGALAYAEPLPRSFSTNSAPSDYNGNDDFKELVRAASTSTLGNRIDLSYSGFSTAKSSGGSSVNSSNNNNNTLQQRKDLQAGKLRVPRSASVGMAKIEEDTVVEFGDVGIVGVNFGVGKDKKKGDNNGQVLKEKFRFYPRSRSYAAGSTKRATVF